MLVTLLVALSLGSATAATAVPRVLRTAIRRSCINNDEKLLLLWSTESQPLVRKFELMKVVTS